MKTWLKRVFEVVLVCALAAGLFAAMNFGSSLGNLGGTIVKLPTSSSGSSSLAARNSGGAFATIASITFDASHFTYSAAAPEGYLRLDWGAGGPASLSEAETIAGNWVNTASPWADNEVANNITVDLATAATGLASNPTDCSAGTFATTIAASGNLTCAQVAFADLSGAATDAQVPNTITVDLATAASGLAANGANCSAGSAAGGVDAAGAAESCIAPLLLSGGTMAGNINFNANLALNLGNAGTDFTSFGGLVIAGSIVGSDDVAVTGVGQFGSTSTVAYSRFGTPATGHSLGAADDLIIGDDFEVDGDGYFDGILTIAGLTTLTNASQSAGLEFGANGYLKLPVADAPFVLNENGVVRVDTSGFGQLVYYASGSAHALSDENTISFSFASTSFNSWPGGFGTGSRSLGIAMDNMTLKECRCIVSSGTNAVIRLSDGTNDTESLTCGTTNAYDASMGTNSSFTKAENIVLEVLTKSGAPDVIAGSCTWTKDLE